MSDTSTETVESTQTSAPPPEDLSVEAFLAEYEAEVAKEEATNTNQAEQSAEPPATEAKKDEPQKPSAATTALLRAQSRLAAREAKVAEMERALREKTRPETTESKRQWTKASIKADPMSFLKEQGIEPGNFARALLAEELGNEAPDEYRKIASGLKQSAEVAAENEALRKKIEDLESRFSQRDQVSEHQRIRENYYRQVEAGLSGDLKEAPVVAAMYAKDKARLMDEISKVVAEDAAQKLRSGGGDPMTPQEAIKAVNSRYSWLASEFTSSAKAKPRLGNEQPNQPAPHGNSIEEAEREADAWLEAQLMADRVRK